MKSITNSFLFQFSGHMHVLHITRHRWWIAILQATPAFLINSAGIPSSPDDLSLFCWSMAANTYSSSDSGSAVSKSIYLVHIGLSFDSKRPLPYSCHLPRTSPSSIKVFTMLVIYAAFAAVIHGFFHFLCLIREFL